jgi:hypothetical protein
VTLTERDIFVLFLLRRYYYLRARQIGAIVAPHDKDGAIIRGRLRLLEKAGLVRRCEKAILDHTNPETAAPVWILTLRGSTELARARQDTSLLFHCEPSFRDFSSLNHYCRLSALHILLDAAIAAQDRVKLSDLTFEHEVIDPSASDPAKKFKLYTQVSNEPKIPCVPDTGFVTTVSGRKRAFFTELETGSDSPARAVSFKHKGYALLHETRKFLDIFPDVTDFRVLCFCPYTSWRKTMQEQMKGKPGEALWLFLTTSEITAANFLHGDLAYKVESDKPIPLFPAPATPSPGGGAGGGAPGGGREGATA